MITALFNLCSHLFAKIASFHLWGKRVILCDTRMIIYSYCTDFVPTVRHFQVEMARVLLLWIAGV